MDFKTFIMKTLEIKFNSQLDEKQSEFNESFYKEF